jgi:hypothetical protein
MGFIAGVILVIMLGLSLVFMDGRSGDMAMRYGELIGYTTMIVAFSLIFVGIRKYRDQHLGGAISFSKAFQMGILITLIASVLYVVGWMLLSELMAPDFMERYAEFTIRTLEEKGASIEEIAQTKAATEQYIKLYKNPLIKFGMTFTEVFPVGLIVTIISSLILRKK